MKNKYRLPIALILGAALLYACNNPNQTTATESESPVLIEEVIEETEVWIIQEESINDVPIASSDVSTPGKAPNSQTDADTPVEKKSNVDDFKEALSNSVEIETVELESVTEIAIPLEETQTVVAFNKKGQANAVIQVVSDMSTGDIDYITFADKHHLDEYDVQAGMTVKEMKRLRKDLKHMKHRGKAFYYHDDSNIMYLVGASFSDGSELVEADLDEMEISAIVWKDKNHENHPKHKKNKI
ncbi:hypothetical protein [Pararhodonellum marinum]|uniref:hypothetical protein n=1 Tax=Pararhodonellum marinum TaxID=2755358 RepID=UPI00188E06AC|nr:hypothetical protein [Pararhodonellum marinum]